MPNIPGLNGTVGPFPSEYTQVHVFARDIHSGSGNCVCGMPAAGSIHYRNPEIDVNCDEDGDEWFVKGHVDLTAFGEAVGRALIAEDASHLWWKPDNDNDELGEYLDSETTGAFPITQWIR